MRAVGDTDPQEEARFRGGLTAFEDPELVRRTAEACFVGELIRTQDRGLMLMQLMGARHARRVAWPIVKANWESGVETLDRGGKHRVISALSQLSSRDLEAEARAWLEAKRAPDSEETTAQTLERLRLNAEAAERLSQQLGEALSRVN
jgi:aminopeptidase N